MVMSFQWILGGKFQVQIWANPHNGCWFQQRTGLANCILGTCYEHNSPWEPPYKLVHGPFEFQYSVYFVHLNCCFSVLYCIHIVELLNELFSFLCFFNGAVKLLSETHYNNWVIILVKEKPFLLYFIVSEVVKILFGYDALLI